MSEAAAELGIRFKKSLNGKEADHFVGKNLLLVNLRYIGILQEKPFHNCPHDQFLKKGYFSGDFKMKKKSYVPYVTSKGMDWLKTQKDRIEQSELHFLHEKGYVILE